MISDPLGAKKCNSNESLEDLIDEETQTSHSNISNKSNTILKLPRTGLTIETNKPNQDNTVHEYCKVITDLEESNSVTILKQSYSEEIINNSNDNTINSNKYKYCMEVIKPFLKNYPQDYSQSKENYMKDSLDAPKEDFPDYQPFDDIHITEKKEDSKCEMNNKDSSYVNLTTDKVFSATDKDKTSSSINTQSTNSTPVESDKLILKPCPEIPRHKKCYIKSENKFSDPAIAVRTSKCPDDKPTYFVTDKSKICTPCPLNTPNNEKSFREAHIEAIATIKIAFEDFFGKIYSTTKDAMSIVSKESSKYLGSDDDTKSKSCISDHKPKKLCYDRSIETIRNFKIYNIDNKKDDSSSSSGINFPGTKETINNIVTKTENVMSSVKEHISKITTEGAKYLGLSNDIDPEPNKNKSLFKKISEIKVFDKENEQPEVKSGLSINLPSPKETIDTIVAKTESTISLVKQQISSEKLNDTINATKEAIVNITKDSKKKEEKSIPTKQESIYKKLSQGSFFNKKEEPEVKPSFNLPDPKETFNNIISKTESVVSIAKQQINMDKLNSMVNTTKETVAKITKEGAKQLGFDNDAKSEENRRGLNISLPDAKKTFDDIVTKTQSAIFKSTEKFSDFVDATKESVTNITKERFNKKEKSYSNDNNNIKLNRVDSHIKKEQSPILPDPRDTLNTIVTQVGSTISAVADHIPSDKYFDKKFNKSSKYDTPFAPKDVSNILNQELFPSSTNMFSTIKSKLFSMFYEEDNNATEDPLSIESENSSNMSLNEESDNKTLDKL